MPETDTDQIFRQVMTSEPPADDSPFVRATRDFLFGSVWSRPGLSRRDRRWVTLACVAAADAPGPIDAHVRAALASGDLTLDEMLEFVLQFACYSGWPKASHVEGVVRATWSQLCAERGDPAPEWPVRDDRELATPSERIAAGTEEFTAVNCFPPPPADTPFLHVGMLDFVFGHVWRRPGLSRRDRRLITIGCAGMADAATPILMHVGTALETGDLTDAEMDEVVLHFTAYAGFPKGAALHESVQRNRERLGR